MRIESPGNHQPKSRRARLPLGLRRGLAGRSAVVGLSVVATASSVPTVASAAPGDDKVRWKEGWRRIGAPEIVAAEVFLAAHILLERVDPSPLVRGRRGGVLFDEPVRNALRLEGRVARERASDVSDVLLTTMVVQPLVVDSFVVSGVGHGKTDVFLQTGVINLQSLALTAAVSSTAKLVVGRERPSTRHCNDADYGGVCDSGRNRSYFSGHAAVAATAAGLVCVHHQFLPLYGGGLADDAACVGAVAVAGTTGVLRISADRHYATDVIAGFSVGFVSGYVVPRLLYYRGDGRAKTDSVTSPFVVGYGATF